jgi:hypothetical protein
VEGETAPAAATEETAAAVKDEEKPVAKSPSKEKKHFSLGGFFKSGSKDGVKGAKVGVRCDRPQGLEYRD